MPGVLWVASAYSNGSEGIQPTADRSATSTSITVEIFGLLVHLISLIPVIRQITRFADPFFVTNDQGDLRIGGFGGARA